jgi:adenosylcobinamide-phosphate synthase
VTDKIIAALSPILTLGIAVLLDIFVGDPPNRFHPVAWIGTYIGQAKGLAPKNGSWWPFVYGASFIVFSCVLLVFIGFGIETILGGLPWSVAIVLRGVLVSCLFSSRSLAMAATLVRSSLAQGELAQAREHLAYHLVSRDVSNLSSSQVAAATIESVAENSSDSVIAPFFFFAIGGLPGVLLYRFCNTADAMLGYRTPTLEWLGKFPARLDDVLNWIPARVTAILILLSGRVVGNYHPKAIQVWLNDHNKTASPNSGHPMSAAAGTLGLELEKVDHYVLGNGLSKPTHDSISESVRLLWCVTGLGFVFVSLLSLLLHFTCIS